MVDARVVVRLALGEGVEAAAALDGHELERRGARVLRRSLVVHQNLMMEEELGNSRSPELTRWLILMLT